MLSHPTISNDSDTQIKKFIANRVKRRPEWWTPLWRGLAADPDGKHRRAMGASLWLYLYLLTYTNRKTGIARRRLAQIIEDTGYPLRTVQRSLKRLAERNYIRVVRSSHYLHISVKRWKSFTFTKSDAGQ